MNETPNKQLVNARAGEHILLLYQHRADLYSKLRSYTLKGLESGEAVLLVGTAAHLKGLKAALENEIDIEHHRAAKRLYFVDAAKLLSELSPEGHPDPDCFRLILCGLLDECVRTLPSSIRIWGEMVNIAWQENRAADAIALEQMWNELAKTHSFTLLCSYRLEPFATTLTQDRHLDRVYGSHHYCLPFDGYQHLENAADSALEEVLGESQAGMVRALIKHSGTQMPRVQALFSWLAENMPLLSAKIIRRTRAIFENQRQLQNTQT